MLNECGQRTVARLASGTIGIEAEYHFVDESFQRSGLSLCERRPLRRDDVCDTCFEQADQIELTLADDRTVRLNQCALGFVQSKEDVALSKKRRLR